MKGLWEVVIIKAKDVESGALLIGVGIFGILFSLISAITLVKIVKALVELTKVIMEHVGTGS